ncbi:MAG: hypothetical protein WBR18_12070 [Anaerolineales bacterium]
MSETYEIRWIKAGIAGGMFASVLYPALLLLPGPPFAVTTLAAFLGLSIGVGSLGLRQLIDLHGPSVSASLGAISNYTAGALFTAMALVQLAVKQIGADMAITLQPDLEGVWLGLDVAWDLYIGVGTILFAWAVKSHPRFGWWFAGPGLAVGVGLLVTNLAVFPTPPSAAGLIDLGPLVGLWYLAATIQAWRSVDWARKRLATEEHSVPAF